MRPRGTLSITRTIPLVSLDGCPAVRWLFCFWHTKVNRSHPALTKLALDSVAALEGGVQAGDGVRAVHAPKMRVRASNREQILLGMDPEDASARAPSGPLLPSGQDVDELRAEDREPPLLDPLHDLRLPLHDSGEADGSPVDHPHPITRLASTGNHAFLTFVTRARSSGSAASVASHSSAIRSLS